MERERDSGGGEEGLKRLARAIERFGEVYQRVEAEKLRQMVELEKQRMQFTNDLELQGMNMFMDTQRSNHGKRSASNVFLNRSLLFMVKGRGGPLHIRVGSGRPMSCRVKTLSGRVSGWSPQRNFLSPLCPVQIRPELVKLTKETSTAAEIHLLIIIVFRLLFKGYSPYTMKRAFPWDEQVDVISSDDSSSSDMEMETNIESDSKQLTNNTTSDQPAKERTSEGALARRAEMYQEYMKQIPIPAHRGSVIPFTSWMGLGKSIKQLYGQPLHYLTNILLKQWDQLRMGSEEEYRPLDTIIHPCKAEATIWLMEEVHRHTSSHYHIANLWLSDPMHHAFVDSIFPQLRSKS